MKHLKLLGLAAMATALMALAGSASANPVLTSPAGTEYTGAMTATATGSLLMKTGAFQETCLASTIASNVTTNNTGIASGEITGLTFSFCGSPTIHILQKGSLSIEPNGTVKGSGTQVTWETVGVSCVYGTTTNTTLGTLTGGNPAVINIKASLPRLSGGFLCANPGSLEGQWTVTSPKPLLLN
jgi:hypothetical protein